MTRVYITVLMAMMVCGNGCGPSVREDAVDEQEAEVARVTFASSNEAVEKVAGRDDQKKFGTVHAHFSSILTSTKMFRLDHGRWPNSLEELAAPPATDSGLHLSYISSVPKDPWTEEDYHYEIGDRGPLLVSFGADMTEGGEGLDADIFGGERN
jgi:general secretion pathway protein G